MFTPVNLHTTPQYRLILKVNTKRPSYTVHSHSIRQDLGIWVYKCLFYVNLGALARPAPIYSIINICRSGCAFEKLGVQNTPAQLAGYYIL